VHARITERLEPVAAAQRGKQLPRPGVRDREFEFFCLLALARLGKLPANTISCGACRRLFASSCCACKQRFDLAQLFAKTLFGVQAS
jgi:hypothetical protein